MARYLANCALHRRTGLPEDDAVNTWAFNSTAGSANLTDVGNIAQALTAFYSALDGWFSATLTGEGTLKVYDIEAPEPRVPLATATGPFTTPDAGFMPEEVAVCLSFHGLYESGESQKRRRGRVYLGPLTGSAALLTESDTRTYVNPDLIDAIHQAQADMFTNAFDTQRRRGPAPSSRSSWALNEPPE